MSDATFTFRVEESLKESFVATAKSIDRSGAQLLRDFMRDFIQSQEAEKSYDSWFRQQVQLGIDSANNGNLISSNAVEEDAKKWRNQVQENLAK